MSGQFIAAVCSFALMVSICGAQVCPVPMIPNSSNNAAANPVAGGVSVIYTCDAGFRVAPDITPELTTNIITVTCDGGTGIFPDFQCVPVNPSSCRDYFVRDGLLPSVYPTGCRTVILALASGPVSPVDCCKRSATEFRTRIVQNTGESPITGCDPGTSVDLAIMPTTTFNLATSKLCAANPAIVYGISGAQIAEVVATTRGCSQAVRFTCETITGVALIVRYNGEPSGVIYGTNAFDVQGTDIDLSHYTYTGGACDCANAAAVPSGNVCEDGCLCTRNGLASGGAGTRESITRNDITATNLKYVTHVRASQHNSATPVPNGGLVASIRVQNIRCDETL